MTPMPRPRLVLAVALGIAPVVLPATGCLDVGDPALVTEPEDDGVPSGPLSFGTHIAPILSACPGCHVAGGGSGGLDGTSAEGFLAGGDSGPAVVPCDPEGSYMYRRVRDGEMPQVGDRLTTIEVATIRRWILQGGQATFVAGTCPNPPLD
ncbi:MAG: hypothetical protein IT385_08395 [Deltaproteobacteria bacterium]|nr:hypothetical protein [Deltaproteobacteria bacterium]